MRSFIAIVLILILCVTKGETKEQDFATLEEYFNKNPQILLNFMKKHATEIIKILVEDVEQSNIKQEQNDIMALRKEWETQKKNTPYSIELIGYPFIGKENAKNTFVVYTDFLCPHCASLDETILAFIEKNPTVRYVVKSYTANPLSKKAYAYFYALWQKNPTQAWQFAQILFKSQAVLSSQKEAFLQFAVTTVGADAKAITSAATKPAIMQKIEAGIQEGKRIKIPGTPALVVNDRYILLGESSTAVLQAVLAFANGK